MHVQAKMGATDVLEALYPLLLKHGKPDHVRSDNGPEFIAAGLQNGLTKAGIKPLCIYLGRTATMNASTEPCAAKS